MFFEPLPPPEPEPDYHKVAYFSSPDREPEHWLPGSAPLGVRLAGTPTTSLFLMSAGCYPQGLAIEFQARVSPGEPIEDVPGRYRFVPFIGDLRLGMLWPDGRSAAVDHRRGRPTHARTPHDLHLVHAGGGGGGISWAWKLWLWPLPPSGPVDVFCMWPERGIPETSTTVDLGGLVAAADGATELWPLPPQPEPPAEGGWFAYAPLRP